MTDDLRSTLEAAVELHEKEGPNESGEIRTVPEAPKTPEEGTKPEAPATDEKAAETKPLESADKKPTEGSPPESAKTDVDEQGKPAPVADKPPTSWKAAPKALWDKVDPIVKAEIRRREKDAERVIAESANVRKFAEGFSQVVKPFAARIQQANVHPLQAVKALLEIDHVLAMGPPAHKAMTIAKLIKDYGVDVAQLDAALSGENVSETDPTSIIEQRIQQALKPVQETLQQFTARDQQQARAEMEQQARTIEQMTDNPKYPHFDTVREEMADLIEFKAARGVYLTLDDAYNQAVRMSPEAQQAEQENAQRHKAEKANKDAQRALGASLSVSGAPSTVRAPVDPSDLRATIEAAVAAHSGR